MSMKISKLILILVTASILLVTSCTNEPVFPLEPRIEFVDIQPKDVRHLQDSIVITFRFQDGDGNLGADDGEINLELIDSRVNNGLTPVQASNVYSIPDLTPNAKNPSIQGEISVTIPLTINLPTETEEDIRYQIKMWDRAGNLATPINENTDGRIFTDFIRVYRP